MNYDTKEGMQEAIQSLQGMWALMKARYQAGYKREERLQEWVLFGRLRLDTCGNALSLYERDSDPFDPDTLPRILTWKEFGERMPGRHSWSMQRPQVPKPEDRCGVCKKSWAIFDWWTFQSFDDGKPFHPTCWRSLQEATNEAFFLHALEAAGFGPPSYLNLEPLPNGYWRPEDPWAFPWFKVTPSLLPNTPAFGHLRMGWRKRVVHLEWDPLVLTRQPDFAKEDVTKDESSIHAWGLRKLVEYLEEIRKCSPLVAPREPT